MTNLPKVSLHQEPRYPSMLIAPVFLCAFQATKEISEHPCRQRRLSIVPNYIANVFLISFYFFPAIFLPFFAVLSMLLQQQRALLLNHPALLRWSVTLTVRCDSTVFYLDSDRCISALPAKKGLARTEIDLGF